LYVQCVQHFEHSAPPPPPSPPPPPHPVRKEVEEYTLLDCSVWCVRWPLHHHH
jgi:hypothetical protein